MFLNVDSPVTFRSLLIVTLVAPIPSADTLLSELKPITILLSVTIVFVNVDSPTNVEIPAAYRLYVLTKPT